MAFLRYACAQVKTAGIEISAWDSLCQKALSPAPDFRRRTAKVILQEYDPKRYLLSHCTIIASVDTEESDQPLGKHLVEGFQVDRRYSDFLITPATSKYANNNNDSWERKLLLGCFKTFVGGENYVEHIQIPELSKGKIIDAAARDIGDSIYVDILIATDRQHDPLVRAITSGQLNTLSMGCSVEFTICTKCGNVAEDETKLCPCVRYFKGSEYIDSLGNKRKIAELCGHHTIPSSVKFVEASWVANPAFPGAVLRGILSPKDLELGRGELSGLSKRLQVAFSQPPRVADPNLLQKAAHSSRVGEDQFEGVNDSKPADKKEADPLDKAVKDLASVLKDKAIEQVRTEINKGEASKVREVIDENRENESLIKSALIQSALQQPEWQRTARKVTSMVSDLGQARKVVRGLILYKSGGWEAVRKAKFSGREVLAISRVLDTMTRRSSMAGEARIYRVVVAVGGTAPYPDVDTYLAACRQMLGRITGSEAAMLIEKGRLFALGSP